MGSLLDVSCTVLEDTEFIAKRQRYYQDAYSNFVGLKPKQIFEAKLR